MSAAVSVELTLPGVTASVPAARRFVRVTLQSWKLDPIVDAAAQVVSELATNAVLHAHSAFTIRMALDAGGAVRLEVADGSRRQPAQRHHSAGSTTGRGLSIVQGLASEWGVDERPEGKSVWAQLAPRESSQRPVAAQEGPMDGSGRRRGVDPLGPGVHAA